MSKLERLIQQYCPDGVEYRSLGDVCIFADGFPLKADDIKGQGIYPVVKIGNINNGVVDEQDCYLTSLPSKVKTSQILSGGEILVGMSGSTGKTGYSVLQNAIVNQRIAIIRNNDLVLNGYLKHSLVNNNFESYCFQKGTGPQHNVSKFDLLSYKIPVPPLPVQEEIVRILDTFTELQAELQAELQKRQQQYNFYRDNLLTNFTEEQNVKEYSLGELGTFTRGNGLQKKDFTKEGVGCIHYGQIYTRFGAFADKTLTYVNKELASRLLQVEKGNLVIACTSENVEDICKSVAWLGEENICTGGHACVFKHNQNPKYISYFFQTEYFFKQKKKYTYGTKVKDIKPDSIAKIKISLPSLKEQERIVSILDNLYTLTNDLTSGLPAEMEKRRQQYEFYRDKLLTFKRKEA